MNARWQDTPAAVLLRLLADLITVNVLAIICFFPVFTIGASLSAMYAVLFKREREDGSVEVIKTFFKAFLRNFGKATLLELVLVLIIIVAAGDFWYASQSDMLVRTIFAGVGTVIALVAGIVFLLAFAQQSVYRNSIVNYLKNSMVLAMCAPGQLLLAMAAWILPWYLAYVEPEMILRLGVLYIMCGFSFPAWATVKLMNPVFTKTKQADTASDPE